MRLALGEAKRAFDEDEAPIGAVVVQGGRVIARAIVTDPKLIPADEPTGNLDAASAEEVLTLLSRLNKEFDKTIVMVTHDPHAARYATVTRHLEKGRLLPVEREVARS